MVRRLAFRLFLAWALVASIGAVLWRRVRGRSAHPSWSLPYEVAVELLKRFMANGFDELRDGRPGPRTPSRATR